MLFSSVDIQKQKARADGPIVFPFNTAVDGTIITGSPVFRSNVLDLFRRVNNHIQVEDAILPDGTLDATMPLSEDTVGDSLSVCCKNALPHCNKKQWFMENRDNVLGFIGYRNSVPVAILEIMRSEACPFTGITQNQHTAAILCFYSNPDDYDYKYDLLRKSVDTIKDMGIRELEVIVGERGYYPNGSLRQFEDYGFVRQKALGRTYLLNRGYDALWLIRKTL
jgi:hypothetical protein